MEVDEAEAAPSTSGLPPHLELQRTRMVCGPNINRYVRGALALAWRCMPVNRVFYWECIEGPGT